MSEYRYHLFESPIGWIGLLGSPRGLRRSSLKATPLAALEEIGLDSRGVQPDASTQDPSAFTAAQSCLARYFQGEVAALEEITVDLSDASPFFAAAWAACRRIPPGETRSYAWLAAKAGRPRAMRAAGQAMARNRLVLVVPCHRVIGSDGDLHGYGAGGLEMKARLLAWEQANAGRD